MKMEYSMYIVISIVIVEKESFVFQSIVPYFIINQGSMGQPSSYKSNQIPSVFGEI